VGEDCRRAERSVRIQGPRELVASPAQKERQAYAADAGLAGRYDLVTIFEALHVHGWRRFPGPYLLTG
jgi:hypothetical protein